MAEPLFDGIACNDEHMTTEFSGQDSYMQFRTPDLTQWSTENTIELWFKLANPDTYRWGGSILSMAESQDSEVPYY